MVRKIKDSCYLSILKSSICKVKFMLEFLNDNLSPTCHGLDDLNATMYFQL